MIPVREFILSLGPPAAISWTGFVVLALALIGEAGIFLLPDKLDRFHKSMGFWLAMLAATGYAIERIGDDAIISSVGDRETQARLELAQIEAARIVTPSQQQTVVQLLADAAKGPISVVYPMTDSTDARNFAESIKATLKKAGYTLADAPQGYAGMLSFSEPGAFLLMHTLTAPSPVAAAVQRAFAKIGIFLVGIPKPEIPEGMVVLVVSSHPFSLIQVPSQLVAAPIDKAPPASTSAIDPPPTGAVEPAAAKP
jgi:hypothetical protein